MNGSSHTVTIPMPDCFNCGSVLQFIGEHLTECEACHQRFEIFITGGGGGDVASAVLRADLELADLIGGGPAESVYHLETPTQ